MQYEIRFPDGRAQATFRSLVDGYSFLAINEFSGDHRQFVLVDTETGQTVITSDEMRAAFRSRYAAMTPSEALRDVLDQATPFLID